MPVSGFSNIIEYQTFVPTILFTFPFYVSDYRDLIVFTFDPTGDIVIFYTHGTGTGHHWTLVGEPANLPGPFPTGGTVVLNAGISGLILYIIRRTIQNQLTEFIDNAPFTAESFNNALDKLTVEVQDVSQNYKGIAVQVPTGGSIAYVMGDWFRNQLPAPGMFFGWVCIGDGTPGTWKGFGLIES